MYEENVMRISDIMRLGKSAIIFATIVVAFLAIIWLLGYKMIYKKILHGKKVPDRSGRRSSANI